MIHEKNYPGVALKTAREKEAARKEDRFQSFFLGADLRALLDQPQCVGIRFYIVPQIKGLPGTVTHCGVSAVLTEGGTAVAPRARHTVSDRPCPGFCVLKATTSPPPLNGSEQPAASRDALAPVAAVAPPPQIDTEKYLVIW